MKSPLGIYPSLKLVSREVMGATCTSIIQIIKNSEHFVNIVQVYLNNNKILNKNK